MHVEQLAREACRTIVATEHDDGAQPSARGSALSRLKDQRDALDRRLDLIEANAAHMQADAIEGALFQLVLPFRPARRCVLGLSA